MTEPLTPVQIESKLRSLVNDITRAQKELAACRDVETESDILYRKAKLTAAHAAGCPVVARGGTTVAERDAWIEEQAWQQYEGVRRAETAREIAQDALRAQLAVSEVVRSLSASVRTAYAMSGDGR